ncbi:TniQ family protein [Deinococcus radiotolerans]|uniref:TniQ domain-containing protein n=1 Tax=Deinococcus radiotolerans TaxID=1309407 RepID=A0ABQ2FP55_9DEIO|nr:TniQ family protein [Deinococcus radiotolerans]GGL13141.1 hypothetical protein GCM10010844_34930 [Deinococcus radiotolerans]
MGKRRNKKTILSYMPTPIFDEGLESWFYRGGLECGLKPSHLLAAMEEDFPNEIGLIRSDLQQDAVSAVRLLRDMTNHPIYALSPLFLPSRYAGAHKLKDPGWSPVWPEYKHHQQWILPSRESVFCPLCLASDQQPYFRRVWRTMVALACPVHNVRLLDRCPHCRTTVRKHFARDLTGDQSMCQQCYEPLCSVPHDLVAYENATSEVLTDVVLSNDVHLRPYTTYRDGRVDGMSFSTAFLDWVLHMPVMAINRFLPDDEGVSDRWPWPTCGFDGRVRYVSSFHYYLSLSLYDRVDVFKRLEPSTLALAKDVLRMHGDVPRTFTLLDSLYAGDASPSPYQQLMSLMDEGMNTDRTDDIDYLEYVFYNAWYQHPSISRMEYLGHIESLHLAIDLCHKKHALVCIHAEIIKPRLTKALNRGHSYECPGCHRFFAVTSSRTYFQPPNIHGGLYE